MDELTSALETSFAVSNIPNDPHRSHPRFGAYKSAPTSDPRQNQQVRRERQLAHQKKRREDFINHARALADGDVDTSAVAGEMDEGDEAEVHDMDTGGGDGDGGAYRPRKLYKQYRNQLMMSEWLVDVPEDLADKWLMVLCPEGKRNLVVAGSGKTKQFSLAGKLINSFPSHLPGGSRKQNNWRTNTTLLDCIFSTVAKTFYVLDMMVWRSNSFYDCETDCRFHLLTSKLDETEGIGQRSKLNPYAFVRAPAIQHKCNAEAMGSVLRSTSLDCPIDGLLFYHREVHYLPGHTPLVGWLKPYMLPELLGVDVPENLAKPIPHGYASMQTYLSEEVEKYEKKKKGIVEKEKDRESWEQGKGKPRSEDSKEEC
jgi:snurportin-1